MSEEELYLEHKPLIYMAIKQNKIYYNTDDEFQQYYDAGEIALIRGIRTYKPEKGYKISTYLFSCISNELRKVVRINNMPKRVNPYGKDISLNVLIKTDSGEGDPSELIDFIPSSINVEKMVEDKIKVEDIGKVVNSLKKERTRKVIIRYYGLDGFQEETLEEIGKRLGVTKEMVRNIRDRGLAEIRKKIIKKWGSLD